MGARKQWVVIDERKSSDPQLAAHHPLPISAFPQDLPELQAKVPEEILSTPACLARTAHGDYFQKVALSRLN